MGPWLSSAVTAIIDCCPKPPDGDWETPALEKLVEERPILGHSQCNLRPQSSFLNEASKFVGDREAVRKMLRAWTPEQRLQLLWTSQPPGRS